MKLGIVVPMIYLPSIENSAVVLLLLLLFPLHLELKTGKLFAGACFHELKCAGTARFKLQQLFEQTHAAEVGLGAFLFFLSLIHCLALGRPEESGF